MISRGKNLIVFETEGSEHFRVGKFVIKKEIFVNRLLTNRGYRWSVFYTEHFWLG